MVSLAGAGYKQKTHQPLLLSCWTDVQSGVVLRLKLGSISLTDDVHFKIVL